MKTNHYILYLLLILFSVNAHAFSWQDLWQNKNQRAKEMMKKQDFNSAKNTFQDDNWRAVAAFRAKDYQLAADLFAKSTAVDANYNLGNALAYLGKYAEAIAAYDKALATNKNNQDAKHNKELLEKLLQQQKNKDKDNKPQNQQQKPTEQEKPEKKNNSNSQNDQENNKNADEPQKPKASESEKNTRKQQKIDNQDQKPSQEGSKNQMQEQWLKLIPDDPGGLLREKFKRDYLRKRG